MSEGTAFSVYEATDGGHGDQKVLVKVLTAAKAAPDDLVRFQLEAGHPKVLDVGKTAEGAPFLVAIDLEAIAPKTSVPRMQAVVAPKKPPLPAKPPRPTPAQKPAPPAAPPLPAGAKSTMIGVGPPRQLEFAPAAEPRDKAPPQVYEPASEEVEVEVPSIPPPAAQPAPPVAPPVLPQASPPPPAPAAPVSAPAPVASAPKPTSVRPVFESPARPAEAEPDSRRRTGWVWVAVIPIVAGGLLTLGWYLGRTTTTSTPSPGGSTSAPVADQTPTQSATSIATSATSATAPPETVATATAAPTASATATVTAPPTPQAAPSATAMTTSPPAATTPPTHTPPPPPPATTTAAKPKPRPTADPLTL